MATLSEQLTQAAAALSIAGVPATAQPGQSINASLTPPLSALHFTDVVNTDISLDLIAKMSSSPTATLQIRTSPPTLRSRKSSRYSISARCRLRSTRLALVD